MPEALTALVTGTAGRLGRLDCLINNAGWHPPHKPIDAFTLDEFESLMRLNVTSVFVGCRAAMPFLRQSRGSIINIASLVATIGQHHATTYVASKGAVLSFTKALAVDEARHGVRVNAVSPGNIDTPLWQEAVDQSPDPGRTRAEGEAAQPMGRMGTAEEVGRLCLFLAAEATFTTGVDHIISGGAELGYGRKTRDAHRSGTVPASIASRRLIDQMALEDAPAPVDARLQRLLVEAQGGAGVFNR